MTSADLLALADRCAPGAGRGDGGRAMSACLDRVIADMRERERRGIEKYGTSMDRTDLSRRQWLQHAYEEALDLALYLRRALDDETADRRARDLEMIARGRDAAAQEAEVCDTPFSSASAEEDNACDLMGKRIALNIRAIDPAAVLDGESGR